MIWISIFSKYARWTLSLDEIKYAWNTYLANDSHVMFQSDFELNNVGTEERDYVDTGCRRDSGSYAPKSIKQNQTVEWLVLKYIFYGCMPKTTMPLNRARRRFLLVYNSFNRLLSFWYAKNVAKSVDNHGKVKLL